MFQMTAICSGLKAIVRLVGAILLEQNDVWAALPGAQWNDES
jgi:hypothetical protein